MKALVISPQPFFSPRGTPYSVYYRCLISAELGVEIDLLTYGKGEDVDITGMRIIRIPSFNFLGNVKTGPSFLKLFLDIFMVLWTVALLLHRRYDFVYAHEESIFFCRFLRPIFRFKLVYDMHSSLPQQLTNFQFTNSKFIIGLFKRLEDSCLKNSDAVITICPDLANYVEKFIDQKNKHYLIENSIFEPVRLTRKEHEPKKSSNRLHEDIPKDLPEGRVFIVYAGTLEHYQGIDILVNSFRIVLAERPDAYLLIVGGTDSQVEFYSSLADQSGIKPNTLFTGSVSQALAKCYTRLASVLVSPRHSGTNTPLKIYEQLSSGIPLVATNIYSHTQVLNDDVAYLVDPEPNDMARGIIEALDVNGKRAVIVKKARQLYEEKYSRKMYKEKMRHLLELISCNQKC